MSLRYLPPVLLARVVSATPLLAIGVVLGIGGCDFEHESEDPFRSEPAGACYEANLLDGIDDTSTDELHAVFACLNADGALNAYAPLDAALDTPTRDGVAGLVLLDWLGTLPEVDVSPRDLLDEGLAVLDDPDDLLKVLRMGLELVYATPWSGIGTDTPVNSQASLDGGVVVPLFGTAGAMAGVVLDDDLAPVTPVVDLLRSDTLRQLAWTVASVGTSSDDALTPLGQRGMLDTSDAIARTRSPQNDRWSGASGDSLRDLAEQVFTRTGNDGRPVIEHLGDPLRPILADDEVRDRLEAALRDEYRAGRLDPLPSELAYLASVDARGGALSPGEDSALVSLVRLLHSGDTEVNCSIDLGIGTVDVSLGNLSLQLLQLFADADPDTLVSGVDLLGTLFGIDLTDSVLDGIADSGVCPVIDSQMVSDLHAIDRLNDDGAGSLLYVMLDVLDAIDAPTTRIPELVDLLGTLDAFDLVPPIEEVLRDLDGAPLVDDVVAYLPALFDPWAHHDTGFFPADVEPVDFDDVWGMLDTVLAQRDDGGTYLGDISGVLNAAMAQEGTWVAVGNLGRLLGHADAEIAGVIPFFADHLADDPDLAVADDLADVLDDPTVVRAPLVIVEADGMRNALATTQITQPGPIPFTTQLVAGGTLDAWLQTLRLLSSLLPPEDP